VYWRRMALAAVVSTSELTNRAFIVAKLSSIGSSDNRRRTQRRRTNGSKTRAAKTTR